MEAEGGGGEMKKVCKLLWSTVAQWELKIVYSNLTSNPFIKKE
jgi:hypothetical protein